MRRLALAAAVAAVGALAAVPSADAKIAPPPYCLNTAWGYICTTDIGPYVSGVLQDPVGTVCHNELITCGEEQS